MDLSYGAEYEEFRQKVRIFLSESWPLRGKDAELPMERQAALFREGATRRGYLARNIPRRYGGSEQALDVLEAQIIREEFRRARAPGEARGIGTMMLVVYIAFAFFWRSWWRLHRNEQLPWTNLILFIKMENIATLLKRHIKLWITSWEDSYGK